VPPVEVLFILFLRHALAGAMCGPRAKSSLLPAKRTIT
jgi:hypothetical protein